MGWFAIGFSRLAMAYSGSGKASFRWRACCDISMILLALFDTFCTVPVIRTSASHVPVLGLMLLALSGFQSRGTNQWQIADASISFQRRRRADSALCAV